MRKIDKITWSTGPAVGSDGLATATGHSPHVNGRIMAVHVDYQDDPPAGTTDFTLSDESDPASEAIISLTDAATDIKIYPRRVTEKNDGTDILYTTGEEVHEPYVVDGRLEATIAQANADDYVEVTVWLEVC
jgi:hypothetical protein